MLRGAANKRGTVFSLLPELFDLLPIIPNQLMRPKRLLIQSIENWRARAEASQLS